MGSKRLEIGRGWQKARGSLRHDRKAPKQVEEPRSAGPAAGKLPWDLGRRRQARCMGWIAFAQPGSVAGGGGPGVCVSGGKGSVVRGGW